MQISRHWRLNAQRYRLQGYRHADGSLSLQIRPEITTRHEHEQADRAEKNFKPIVVPAV